MKTQAHKKHSGHGKETIEETEKKEMILMEEGLKAIYGKETTDFTKIERPQGWLTRTLLWTIGALSVLALLAWGGFFFYARYFTAQNPTNFVLTLEGPDTVKSGDHASFAILYKNPTNLPVASLTIEARLPDGFRIDTMNPAPLDSKHPSWNIGSISAGSDGKITLDGTWLVTVPSSTPLQAFATFRPGNFNSDFQDVATKTVATTESVLTTTTTAPPDMTAGVSDTFTFTVTNTSSAALTNIKTNLTLPAGFYLESSTPPLEPGTLPSWDIASLESGAVSTISVVGSFAADVLGVQELDLAYSLNDDKGDHLQTVAKSITEVKASDLHLSLVAQGSNSTIAPALGSNVSVTIALENASKNTMNTVAVLLDVGGDKTFPISWKQADLGGGTLTKDGILWDTNTIGTLSAGGTRTLTVRLPIVSTLTANMGDTFTLSAMAKRGSATIRSSLVTATLESDAKLSASATYFTEDGIPLGNGPIPPTVGQATTYRITWNVTNSLHALSPMTVSATLPAGVTFASQESADLGSITFNSTTNMVEWKIPTLAAETKSASATFAVAVTPTDADVGTFAKLLSGSLLTATDAATKTTLSRSTTSLDTELPNDPFAEGKGAIVAAE